MMHTDTSSERKLHVCIFGISLFSAVSHGSVVREPSRNASHKYSQVNPSSFHLPSFTSTRMCWRAVISAPRCRSSTR